MLAAIEEGRCSAEEGERLLGFVVMGDDLGHSPSTVRRRRARLRELGIPGRTPIEDQAHELSQLVERGEMTYAEAERRMGRFALSQLEVDIARQ